MKLFADTAAKSCVYNCTPGTYAYNNIPYVPASDNKTCVSQCPGDFFADNSTGYGLCVKRCPDDPPLYGDVRGNDRLCVQVCQVGFYGYLDAVKGRLCNQTCPNGFFSQNDSTRLCVKRCNSTTYGDTADKICKLPFGCLNDTVGDPSTTFCTSRCTD